jgi:oligoendopeptidase F
MTADIQKIPRHFIPQHFQLNTWQDLEPFFIQLQQAEIQSKEELEKWLLQWSELQAVISEDACWRQIKMTCDTTDKQLEDAFTFFCTEIQPPITAASDVIHQKLISCAFTNQLDADTYEIYLRSVKKDLELFASENIPLQSQESILAQQFGSISAKMTITVDDKEYTLQQAAKFLMQNDRALRKSVYQKIAERRLQDKAELNILFDKLLALRHQIAKNAGFDNYRDFKFKELGRFDYTVADCTQFHDAVKEFIIPLCEKIYEHKKNKLGLDVLHVYDVEAEPEGITPLSPFKNGDELIEKSIIVFDKLGPFFGDCLRKMQAMQHLDLDSKKGKAPGGYNCPLAETGVPFIFMNAASTADDVVTMMHEGGHAIHSFVCHNLELNAFKEYPMEIAELASMSMELFSMSYWDAFYENPEELLRAKAELLERALTILPWIATIDKFQHWLYTNVGHSNAQRQEKWIEILKEFSVKNIDYSGFENYREHFWQKQLHLFEVPFYYIEYGIAQLGAIGMWQQYKHNPKEALANYVKALSLGNTKSLKELYATAGISFDFGKQRVQQLSAFVQQEMLSYQQN